MANSSSESSQTISNTATKSSKFDNLQKCSKCLKRYSLKSCSQSACFKCCADKSCLGHKKKRLEAKHQEQILDGTNWISRYAAQQRALAVRKGSFREPSFRYLGDTLTVWSLTDYLNCQKWREDAVRRSRKMKGNRCQKKNMTVLGTKGTVNKRINRGRRFRGIMTGLLNESICELMNSDANNKINPQEEKSH